MAPSRAGISASSITCGSSEWLPLVITAGPSSPAITKRCSGVVGSMNPKVERPGATALGQALGPVRAQHHDRRRRPGQRALLFRRDRAIAPDHRKIARHQGKGLGVAVLEPAQPGDRGSVGRIAGELIAAEPLNRDDLARTDQPGRREGRLARRNFAQNFLGRRRRRSGATPHSARNRGRRSPAHGSGGRPDRGIRHDRPRTAETAPSSSRTRSNGMPSAIVSRGPQWVQLVKG